ncbi:MAG TPA: glycyl-radical enzyme activating protein [Candidatus Methylomirabilis sp.]|nr:glycyl-radical enzyme activating protein [Candidatus Methylomirabilis sp.]
MTDPYGLIFDIQRFSIHDGSGIRTLVFLKGCPLRCVWCCNPESQATTPELALFLSRCIGCGACEEACPNRAVSRDGAAGLVTERSLCEICGRCVEVCPAEARVLRGRRASVKEVLCEVERDDLFYRTSGGGVTVSGGEPLLQADFVAELLKVCRQRGIDTAIETCGHAPWEDFARVLAHTDTVLFDVKHADPLAHRRFTGVGNELILANLRQAVKSGVRVVLRLPLVPGVNADAGTVRSIASLARELGIAELHLLAYHRLGESKYQALGLSYPLQDLTPPTPEQIEALRRVAEEGGGLSVSIGG